MQPGGTWSKQGPLCLSSCTLMRAEPEAQIQQAVFGLK